jgi:hypothetical protein
VAPGATQEERDAMRFQAIKANFDWSNEEWASTWPPEDPLTEVLRTTYARGEFFSP